VKPTPPTPSVATVLLIGPPPLMIGGMAGVVEQMLGLDFGGVDFWTDRPVSELIAEAGAQPVEDPADLELQGVSDDAWAALYEVLGSAR